MRSFRFGSSYLPGRLFASFSPNNCFLVLFSFVENGQDQRVVMKCQKSRLMIRSVRRAGHYSRVRCILTTLVRLEKRDTSAVSQPIMMQFTAQLTTAVL
ncbi:hypothetical protein ACOMHN_053794 [Nucella lapillus]